MEFRQNWYKFQRILGFLPPKKQGLAVLHSHGRVLAGAVGSPSDVVFRTSFQDKDLPFEHVENAWEVLAHKYGASGATFVDKEELLNALGQVAAVRTSFPSTENFHLQLKQLRELLKVDRGEKTKLGTHTGDRPVESFWPREHFLFSFFNSFFAELLPERKLLLVTVVISPTEIDSILLEFQGGVLKGFCDPDFTGFDWKEMDLFQKETAARFVLWCENHYMLPTYSLFLSSRVAEESREIQMKHGRRQAWKNFLRTRTARDVEKEILFEPEPWPVKALLRWNAFRG